MKKAFVTYLGSDDFLPGVLVLSESLKRHNKEDLVIIVSSSISSKVVSFLREKRFKISIVGEIKNPNVFVNDIRGFRCVYTKLHMFGLVEFDKIVYIDADMLVCECIEPLFEKPHMSAVIAGALAPENSDWIKLNSGLLVVEPNSNLFERLKSLTFELPSETKDDQGFLQSYYDKWPQEEQLHLEHKYNIPAHYLEKYCDKFDFEFSYVNGVLSTRNIAILHYWGVFKPWHCNPKELLEKNPGKYVQSLKLWLDYSNSTLERRAHSARNFS
jgi:lipopolysaccharide biosynthesis glycosyltransferase